MASTNSTYHYPEKAVIETEKAVTACATSVTVPVDLTRLFALTLLWSANGVWPSQLLFRNPRLDVNRREEAVGKSPWQIADRDL
jgi:hypothetical protein